MILDRSDMWPDELTEALLPQFFVRLGQGTERWLRQVPRDDVVSRGKRAEIARRARLEAGV